MLQHEANEPSYHLGDDLGFLSDSLFKQKMALCVIIKTIIKQSRSKMKGKDGFPLNCSPN